MKKEFLFAFTIIALAIAGAKTHTVNLYQPAKVGTTALEPGTYSIEVRENRAFLRNGKVAAEAEVKVETVERKFDRTAVRYAKGEGDTLRVQEIHIGGTREKLVFNP